MKGLEAKTISDKAKEAVYGIIHTSWNSEIVDDLLGVKSLNKATIPFKISLNTLINYNIIKEINN